MQHVVLFKADSSHSRDPRSMTEASSARLCQEDLVPCNSLCLPLLSTQSRRTVTTASRTSSYFIFRRYVLITRNTGGSSHSITGHFEAAVLLLTYQHRFLNKSPIDYRDADCIITFCTIFGLLALAQADGISRMFFFSLHRLPKPLETLCSTKPLFLVSLIHRLCFDVCDV